MGERLYYKKIVTIGDDEYFVEKETENREEMINFLNDELENFNRFLDRVARKGGGMLPA